MGALLREFYRKVVVKELMEKFGYKNPFEVPKLEKVVVNVALGAAKDDAKLLDSAIEEVSLITGQRPIVRRAKKSVAGFKLRKGQPIGLKVTLRGDRMYDFIYKLVSVVLPRVRDFQGLDTKGFDGRGNYSIGLTEQLVFPEIDYSKVYKTYGIGINIVTTAKTDEEAKALLAALGFPFRGEKPRVLDSQTIRKAISEKEGKKVAN